MLRILHPSADRVKRSPPPASRASPRATPCPAAAGRRRTSCRTGCLPWRGPRRANVPMSTASAMFGTAGTRRIVMMNRPRMVPARRRRWRRAPRVHDNRVLHDDRLLRRLDARSVAMRANGRPVGMRDDLHAVADRAERTVDVTSVNPCAGRHAAGHKGNCRSRQNRLEVLVHDPPPFPFYREVGSVITKI